MDEQKKRGNTENLKPQSKRTKEEQREIASKGGKASVVSRRKKKTMREQAEAMLAMATNSPAGLEALVKVGEQSGTNQAAIIAAIIVRATEGNLSAAEFLRDLIGERPEQKMNMDGTVTFRFAGAGGDEIMG